MSPEMRRRAERVARLSRRLLELRRRERLAAKRIEETAAELKVAITALEQVCADEPVQQVGA